MPRNLDTPYPIQGHPYGLLNYAEGVKFPTFQCMAIPEKTETTGWWTATNLDTWFLDRGSSYPFDLTAISSDIQFADSGIYSASSAGLGAFTLNTPKAAGFTLTVSKGMAPIGFAMRFNGISMTPGISSSPTVGWKADIVDFSDLTLGTNLSDIGIISITLNYDTQLTPNMELDGTRTVKAFNADIPVCTLSIQMYANGNNPPGVSYSSSGMTYSEVTDTTFTIADVVFTIPRMIIQNPDDREQAQGRVVRVYTYTCLSDINGGAGEWPLSVA